MNLSEIRWRKSSRSANGGGNCVEVARGADGAAVRDSKHTATPPLVFPTTAWRAFLAQHATPDP
jgi:hypothetical protein